LPDVIYFPTEVFFFLVRNIVNVLMSFVGMFGCEVSNELVFAVVLHRTQSALVGSITETLKLKIHLLVLGVSTFMVLAISDGGEALLAELAAVGLLTSVGPHVY
jgi:uncharacterized membrane protein